MFSLAEGGRKEGVARKGELVMRKTKKKRGTTKQDRIFDLFAGGRERKKSLKAKGVLGYELEDNNKAGTEVPGAMNPKNLPWVALPESTRNRGATRTLEVGKRSSQRFVNSPTGTQSGQ